ncbi:MAG: tetratricopeptide repeat protein [Promethearchaeota archaeon]|jgi:tetratricopeptide (TPR) repeat protein
MSDSIPEEITKGWQLMNEGKEEEALDLMTRFEKREDLNPEINLRCQILKGFSLLYLGRFEEGLKIGEQSIRESKKLKKYLLLIDAINLKMNALFFLGRTLESWLDVSKSEKFLKLASQEPLSEYEQRKGIFMYMRGCFYFWEGDYNLALEYCSEGFRISEKHKKQWFSRSGILLFVGAIYNIKGDLEQALKCIKRSIELLPGDGIIYKIVKASCFNNIGDIYYQKSDFDQAIEYYKKSLEIYLQLKTKIYTFVIFDNLIKTFLSKKDLEQAKDYLHRYQLYNERIGGMANKEYYNLSRARVLKSSTRTRDRAEAEKILKNLIMEKPVDKLTPEELVPALIELCDLYFKELKLTNDLEIIKDIEPIVKRILKEEERIQSYSLQAYAYLLYGKLSLLQMNMGNAKQYLTKAQQIADPHGLQLLAREISSEHDKLLGQLNKWEDLEKTNATVSERMNMALIEETLNRMQGMSEIKAPEIISEDPILLLILTEGGILMFAYPFVDDWNRDNDLFGNLLSAFTSFSDQFLSQGLDRVKFSEYTVIMKQISTFSVCYMFKGQTYQANQKLTYFIEKMQKNPSIIRVLNKFHQTNQVIEVKDFPFFEIFISEIFNKS